MENSETTIKLSSIKEVVKKSSTSTVQTSLSNSQNEILFPETTNLIKDMEGQQCADFNISNIKDQLPNASTLADKIALCKINDSIENLESGDAMKLNQGEQIISSIASTSKSSFQNKQISSSSSSMVEVTLNLQKEKSQDIEISENCSTKADENGLEISDNAEQKINTVVIEDDLETDDKPLLVKDEENSDEEDISCEEIDEVVVVSLDKSVDGNLTEKETPTTIQLHEENGELPCINSSNSVQKSDKLELVNSNDDKCKDDDEENKVNEESKILLESELKVSDEKVVEGVSKDEESIQEKPILESINVPSKINTEAKHEIINNTIREIISDIDTNIKEDENILQLKQEEIELLKKHEELTKQIQQQQKLAEKLAAENRLQNEELERKNYELNYQKTQQQKNEQNIQSEKQNSQLPQSTDTQFCTSENLTDSTDYFKSVESCTESKKYFDLNKIFTPATDNVDMHPKNRKLYASSAFYSPSLHPTVEDQVELARRISHSLSDISNQTSKGQSMYDNRKKRSVKWVHESIGQGTAEDIDYKENAESESNSSDRLHFEKIPLRLVMNPRGQIIDFNSVHESLNTKTGLLSPDKCAQLVCALQAQKGKGAELFAKRRKKVDKWIIDETNAGSQTPSGIPDHHQMQSPKPPTSPSILPAYSEVGKHRVQLNMHQEQVLGKYAQPSITVVKTPWEAALETGSASAAFVEDTKSYPYPKHTNVQPRTDSNSLQYENTKTDVYQPHLYSSDMSNKQNENSNRYSSSASTNSQRDLAYKPSIPQGWNAPSVTLPKHLSVQAHQHPTEKLNQTNRIQLWEDLLDNVKNEINTLTWCEKMDLESEHQDDFIIKRDTLNDIQKTKSQDSKNLADFSEKEIAKSTKERSVEEFEKNIPQPNQNEEGIYVQVPVRDLILNFEHHGNEELKKSIKSDQPIKQLANENAIEEKRKNRILKNVSTNSKDMYVPKEIPLENYAPPPEVCGMPCRPLSDSSFLKPLREERELSNSFGVSLPSAASPQRQESNWYDGSPQLNKTMPHVNFSPSPLSHEKLSKYQNNNNNNIQSQLFNTTCTRNLNSSPAPFGQPTIGTTYGGQNNSQFSNNNQTIKTPPRTNPPSHFLGNKNNFNNSARGWGYDNNNKYNMPMQTGSLKKGFPVGIRAREPVALPFTDF